MCITRLQQVLVGSDKYKAVHYRWLHQAERFLVSVFPASEKFDSDLEVDAGMHKTDAHSCPPMNNNIIPMPTNAHP
jgi:hypothetical protein